MADYAFEGQTQLAETVTWSYAASNLAVDVAAGYSFSSSLTQPQYQAVVQLALQRWTAVTGIAFVQVADSAASDIRIGWGNFSLSSGGEIGETSYLYNQAAGAILPDTLIRLEDPARDALNGASPTSYTYAGTVSTLYQVIVHEIGHALGMDHSTDMAAIMYPVATTTNRDLDASDIAGIQTLYGQAFAAEASITGAGGTAVDVGFDRASSAALAQSLLNSAAGLGIDTTASAGTPGSSIRFIAATGSYFSHSGNLAVIDDAVGSVTLATNTLANQSIVAGNGGLVLAAFGSGTVVAGGGANQVFVTAATAGPWDAVLGNGNNTVLAATGNETIAAGTGRNLIFLGSGTSSVLSAGADTIVGGAAPDTVGVEGSGALVFGGSGGTTFDAASGVSTVIGYSGSLYAAGGARGGLFIGGAIGGNVIAGGSGPTTIIGGGTGDVLAATGSAANLIAAGSGTETINGGGSSGANVFFAGSGSDLIVSGSGNTAVEVGAGNDTLVGGTGDSLFVFANGQAGGTDLIVGFDPTLDHLSLQGYGAAAPVATLATAVALNGSTFLSLSDGTRIVLAGYTGLTAQSFV